MPALDTNVLVRYVVQDDEAQLAAAKRLIRKCASERQTLFVPVTVALELEWVLRANFGYTKNQTIEVLSNLFSAAELSFESEHALEVALHLYRERGLRRLRLLRLGAAQRRSAVGRRLAAKVRRHTRHTRHTSPTRSRIRPCE